MKNYILITIFILTISSCVTSKGDFTLHQKASTDKRDTYNVLGHTKGYAWAPKVWILFIPIGGNTDQGLYNRAYRKALRKYEGTDGVLNQQAEYKKVKIPLLITTLVYKRVRINGTAFHYKNDLEYNNTKDSVQYIKQLH